MILDEEGSEIIWVGHGYSIRQTNNRIEIFSLKGCFIALCAFIS